MPLSTAQYQVVRDLSTNTSLVTSPAWFTGDFRQLTLSVSTQSNAAINVQSSNADGFQSAIPENSWANIQAISVQSVFVLPVGQRWSRISTPAASSSTIILAGRY